MVTFEEALASCNEITALLDAYRTRMEQDIHIAQAQEAQRNTSYSAALSQYSAEHNAFTADNSRKKNGRLSKAQECLAAARNLLDGINDPHWFRMQQHYYEKTSEKANPDRYHAISPDKLTDSLDRTFSELRKEIAQLRNAFTPPVVSGAVGFAVPPFRKAKYTRIATLRNTLLGMAVALCNRSDLDSRQARIDDILMRVQRELQENHIRQIQRIRENTQNRITQNTERTANVLHASNPYSVLSKKEAIYIGQYVYPNAPSVVSECLDGGESESHQPLFSSGVTCSCFESSAIFKMRNNTSLSEFYSCLALDILAGDSNAQIAVIDIAGFGRNYAPLAALSNVSHFRVLSTADHVQAYLESAERNIAAAYSGKRPVNKTYIFVDDCMRNIPDRCIDSFARIITNGAESNVYVIASVKNIGANNRQWSNALTEIRTKRYEVTENRILVGNGFIKLPSTDGLAERMRMLTGQLVHASKNAEVLPIWRTFPVASMWQAKSSATGICVPIGTDMQTGEQTYFCLTEDKPYGLVIGDVDAGKSSALHCLVLQMLANYAPSEVRIAIGDFKNGCEFDTYIRNGIASIDTVVNSQDPDAMSSFLGFYVAEMSRRQCLFNTTAQQCGRMIRKYETYRKACSDNCLEYVPRIVLIVDEFQNLFDAPQAGTAALLSELVRKGRSYGIHIVMASQRAISDNPRNGFSSELKNYFVTRMVFRCPQQAARTMLSERCADTGRENSGIVNAALLKRGHCVLNTYMGQNERENRTVQCFYPSDSAIEKVICVLRQMNGVSKHGVLLSQDAYSVGAPGRVAGFALLGQSVRLRHDVSIPNEDVFRDNSVVGIDIKKLRSNLVIVSNDSRVQYASFKAIMDSAPAEARINLCGARSNSIVELFVHEHGDRLIHVEHIEDAHTENAPYTINLIVEPEKVAEYSQASSYRRTPTIECFDQILDLPADGKTMNVIFVSNFKTFKTNLPYAATKAPLRIVGVGDIENLRGAINESAVLGQSEFDNPTRSAIKAYYHNRMSGKTGKMIMFYHAT